MDNNTPDIQKYNEFKRSNRKIAWFSKLCTVIGMCLFGWLLVSGHGFINSLFQAAIVSVGFLAVSRKFEIDYKIQKCILRRIDDGFLTEEIENRNVLENPERMDIIELAYRNNVLTRDEYLRKKKFDEQLEQQKRKNRLTATENNRYRKQNDE